MSEEILVQMSQQLGELNGTLKASLKAQADINKALFEATTGQRADIDDLKATRNKLIGVCIASSVGGGGVVATLMKAITSMHGG